MEQLELYLETREMAREKWRLAEYVARYVTDEMINGNVVIDRWMIMDAIDAYHGGADKPLFIGKIMPPVKV